MEKPLSYGGWKCQSNEISFLYSGNTNDALFLMYLLSDKHLEKVVNKKNLYLISNCTFFLCACESVLWNVLDLTLMW